MLPIHRLKMEILITDCRRKAKVACIAFYTPDCILCRARRTYSRAIFTVFTRARVKNLTEALFTVLLYLVPPAHAPSHIITCNLCHNSAKPLFVEPLSPLPQAQFIVLALLSQLQPAHAPYFGDDSPRKNQRMQTGLYIDNWNLK